MKFKDDISDNKHSYHALDLNYAPKINKGWVPV